MFAGVSFGLIAGVLTVFMQAAIATLIFSGDELQAFAGPGTGILLFGSLALGALVGLTSSTVPMIAYVQEAPAAVLGVMTAAVVTALGDATPDTIFGTSLATMAVAGAITAICFWAMGRFSLGKLVRYIPYPVGGGFLAGTGWLLVIGGIGVATEADVGVGLFASDALLRWGPALGFGAVLLVALRRWSHFLVLPGLVAAALVLFYVVYAALNGDVSSAEDDGWLLGPFPNGRLWDPDAIMSVSDADWAVVADQAVGFAAVLVVSVVSLLLNASGMELVIDDDIDIDDELRTTGIGNLIAAAGGSPPGFHALGLSALGHRLGVRTRIGNAVIGGILVLVLLFGATALSVVPRLAAGGFLIYLGLSFLTDWLYETWSRLPRLDYALIWLILVVIATVGFLEGVGVGIATAAVLFLVEYSRGDVVRHATTRADFASATERPQLHEQLLDERGDRIGIITMQGHVFFGTAHRLAERIRTQLQRESPLRFLVLDLHLVTGMDTSAVTTFARMRQKTDHDGITVVLSGIDPTVRRQLTPDVLVARGISASHGTPSTWFDVATLDDGVRWCEERLLEEFAAAGLSGHTRSAIDVVRSRLREQGSAERDWLDDLDPTSSPAQEPSELALTDVLVNQPFEPGDVLVEQGAAVADLVFLERGTAEFRRRDRAGAIVDHGQVRAGTDVMADAFYSGDPSDRTIVATSSGSLTRLPRAELDRLEREQPHVAIAVHRALVEQLGHRARRLSDVARMLQR